MSQRNIKRWMPLIMLLLLMAAVWLVNHFQTDNGAAAPAEKAASARGLNRNPQLLVYTQHAQCRMRCRHISQSEVEDILQRGTINYKKSELGQRPDCERKYAVEGITADRQRVRIIFSPCRQKIHVVTAIDLGKEWPCECK